MGGTFSTHGGDNGMDVLVGRRQGKKTACKTHAVDGFRRPTTQRMNIKSLFAFMLNRHQQLLLLPLKQISTDFKNEINLVRFQDVTKANLKITAF
jgi:hypothetical protein